VESLPARFNLIDHMEVYNGYPLSLVVALILHFLVLAALVYSGITRPPEILDVLQPPTIRALMIDENPQLRNERLREAALARQQADASAAAERRRQEELERQREEQAAAEVRQRQQEQERQRQADLEAQRQQEREAQALRETQEQERQAEQERQRQAELEAERQREQQRQQQLAAEQERQRQAAEAAAAAANVARTEQEMVMAYTSVIHDLVQQNWSRPPSARNGMMAQFRIRMVPTGDILDVELVQSSGDYAFDRAAETAIFRVGRFQELQGMPINMFNQNFRSLLLTFRPEDLLN
jgi:colicin import membrane protein